MFWKSKYRKEKGINFGKRTILIEKIKFSNFHFQRLLAHFANWGQQFTSGFTINLSIKNKEKTKGRALTNFPKTLNYFFAFLSPPLARGGRITDFNPKPKQSPERKLKLQVNTYCEKWCWLNEHEFLWTFAKCRQDELFQMNYVIYYENIEGSSVEILQTTSNTWCDPHRNEEFWKKWWKNCLAESWVGWRSWLKMLEPTSTQYQKCTCLRFLSRKKDQIFV